MRIRSEIKFRNYFLPTLFFGAVVFFILSASAKAQSNVNVTLDVVSATSTPTYVITASAGAGGTILPNGSTGVSQGNSATYTITPNALYEINSVLVDSVNQGTSSTYTFNNVTSNHSINALFDLIPVTPTTTPPTPPNPPSGGGGGGGGFVNAPLAVSQLSVSTAETEATVSWSTNYPTLAVFSWGTTSDYEIGSVSDVGFVSDHQVKIQNLIPNTHYYFKINGRNLTGQNFSYAGDFYTLSLPNLINVPNVGDLIILPAPAPSPAPNSLLITWQNPPVPEFAGVIVVRSPYSYPRDAKDGQIIYQGTDSSTIDTTAKKNTTYYYSVFVYDTQNNFSSGTIAMAKLPLSSVTTTASSTPDFYLKLSDVDFIQDGRSIITSDGLVPVFPDKNLSASISLLKIPAKIDLGTLRVISPTSSSTNNYLFLFNAPRMAYESQVNLYGKKVGIYPFTIEIQLRNGKRGILTGDFAVIKEYTTTPTKTPLWQTIYNIVWVVLVLIIIFLLLLIIILGVWRLLHRSI